MSPIPGCQEIAGSGPEDDPGTGQDLGPFPGTFRRAVPLFYEGITGYCLGWDRVYPPTRHWQGLVERKQAARDQTAQEEDQ